MAPTTPTTPTTPTATTARHGTRPPAVCAALCAWLLACTGADEADGVGGVRILVDAEDSITAGVAAGDRVEDIADGWDVAFERYVVGIGPVTLHQAANPARSREAEGTRVVDLASLGPQGRVLWELDDLAATRWQLQYMTPVVDAATATPEDGVSTSDVTEMADAAASHLVLGSIAKSDGRSCPPTSLATPGGAVAVGEGPGGDACYANPVVAFRFVIDAAASYGPCEVDGMEGFSVPRGGTRTVSLSIHGDHLFFNGFPDGNEGGVVRLAQWLADSDLDLDGEVTRAELETIAPSDLAALDARYNLDLPFEDLRGDGDMWSYLRAQLRTQGHFEGEGECAYASAR